MSDSKNNAYIEAIKILQSFRARREARELCERSLVTKEGVSQNLGEREIRQSYSLTTNEINQLSNEGLLASEDINGELHFEIANDDLVQQVIKSRRHRNPKMLGYIVSIVLGFSLISLVWLAYEKGYTHLVMQYFFDTDLIAKEIIVPEVVAIPSGEYMMGAGDSDIDARSNERPQHRVKIEKSFAMGKYEVTFEEYDLFAMATKRALPNDEGWGRGRRPVVNVSWEDAVAYVSWLSKVTDKSFRLPSEAEWEFAARANSTTKYWWGSEVGADNANCKGCEISIGVFNRTTVVGSFKPNSLGLYDTAGNVSEWVQDCYRDTYTNAPVNGDAWEEGDCLLRVLRGGSWYNAPMILRSSLRSGYLPNFKDNNGGGFRVAMDLE